VLIRHLRSHQPTTDLLATLALEGQVGIATISRTEIVEGMREHERESTLRLLDSLISYPPLPQACPWFSGFRFSFLPAGRAQTPYQDIGQATTKGVRQFR
jgi:hypothetical protein